ncbi:MAG: DUF1801 domain-containing protein [Actinobacteria bacterium]|jgi:uncharacterized protein YdhG (YjbR/CyaY superfamily)|nr:DUF1801 domain-containing protein [Actinomycetota bacterium]
MTAAPPPEIEAYLAGFPDDVSARLRRVRELLLAEVPGGAEKVRYGMPAVMLGGRYAIHYAGWKKHIGLYPVPRFEGPLETDVEPYRSSKDTVNIKHTEPLPEQLVSRIAAAVVEMRGGED